MSLKKLREKRLLVRSLQVTALILFAIIFSFGVSELRQSYRDGVQQTYAAETKDPTHLIRLTYSEEQVMSVVRETRNNYCAQDGSFDASSKPCIMFILDRKYGLQAMWYGPEV